MNKCIHPKHIFKRLMYGCQWRIREFRLNKPRQAHLRENRSKNKIDFGNLRRLTPVSDLYGLDRGQSIARYYIEKFLLHNEADIKGTVLEFQDNRYTTKYGHKRVNCSETIGNDVNAKTTIAADLATVHDLPARKYDCIIATQVLQFIDDNDQALKNLYGMLKEKGVLLCTVPSVSRLDVGEPCDFWRFTRDSMRYLFRRHFREEQFKIEDFGNVFVGICYLLGLCVEDITKKELDYYDRDFPLVICVRAEK